MATGKTVLLVEDNPSVLLLMERALAPDGYTVLTADNGEVALELVGSKGRRVDLLVADLVLPRLGGLELAGRISEMDPESRVILISGYAGEEATLSALGAARVAFLEKPFSATAFRSKVRELLADEESDESTSLGPGWSSSPS